MNRLRVAILLTPALAVVGVLFLGGLGIAISQSLGYFPPGGQFEFTFEHYAALVTDGELRDSLVVTTIVASVATVISAAVGTAIAVSLRDCAARFRFVAVLLQVPLAIPHLAMAIAFLHLASPSGLMARAAYHLGIVGAPSDVPAIVNDPLCVGIILTYVVKEVPFVAVMVLALLARIGDEYDAVAKTLGATGWQRLRHVTLPLVAPATVSASLVAFAFIFGAFEVPYLLGRTYPSMLAVVAQQRFASVDLADRPAATAVAVTISLVAAALVYAYLRMSRALVGVSRPTLF